MKRALVVGSGAGGAMVARELQGTFDVTVLEEGREFRPVRRDVRTLEILRASGLFVDERMIRALFPATRVLKADDGLVVVRGSATGGTTIFNSAKGSDLLNKVEEDARKCGADALIIRSTESQTWKPLRGGIDQGARAQAVAIRYLD